VDAIALSSAGTEARQHIDPRYWGARGRTTKIKNELGLGAERPRASFSSPNSAVGRKSVCVFRSRSNVLAPGWVFTVWTLSNLPGEVSRAMASVPLRQFAKMWPASNLVASTPAGLPGDAGNHQEVWRIAAAGCDNSRRCYSYGERLPISRHA
jgi:hypothetical protein